VDTVNYANVTMQLEQIQRMPCLHIAAGIIIAPMAAVEVTTELFSLSIYIKQAAVTACFWLKKKQLTHNICYWLIQG